MRRLVQHALAAAGISVLTAGVVVTGLNTGSSAGDTMVVAAPVVASSSPSPSVSLAASSAIDERTARGSRGSERGPLSTGMSADARGKVLLTQRDAIATLEVALEKKAAEKKAAEKKAAEKRAAEKRAAEKRAAEKKAAEKRREAAAQKRAAELREKSEREKAAATADKAKRQAYDSDTTSPKSIARQMMQSKYGWGSKQFSCYNNIIMRESAWKVHADNPSSSAYGIPQALPGSKMASAGSDWRTNPATQIEWGLGYVKSRYGTPCSAWGFKSSHGWY